MKFYDVYPNGVGIKKNENENENQTTHDIEIDPNFLTHDIKVVRAPRGLSKEIKAGSELKVLQKLRTPKACPYGEGLPMMVLEKNIIVLLIDNQFAWLKTN